MLTEEQILKNKIDTLWQAHNVEAPRKYLGASILGHKCRRYLWYQFHWAYKEEFSGRIKRLFYRGQREEAVFVASLQSVGCLMSHTLEDQLWVNLAPHVGGHPDGVIESGLPGAERTRHIAEFKTHNDKSFKELQKKGVREAKPMHYDQMVLYMHGTGIERALYFAVNKNDDDYYLERIEADEERAEELIKKAEDIVFSTRAPEPLSTNPAWYECQYCPCHELCFGEKITHCINCRTCIHASAEIDGTWSCDVWKDTIPTEAQLKGCGYHCIHPDLTPFRLWDCKKENSIGFVVDDKMIINGVDGIDSWSLWRDYIKRLPTENNQPNVELFVQQEG